LSHFLSRKPSAISISSKQAVPFVGLRYTVCSLGKEEGPVLENPLFTAGLAVAFAHAVL